MLLIHGWRSAAKKGNGRSQRGPGEELNGYFSSLWNQEEGPGRAREAAVLSLPLHCGETNGDGIVAAKIDHNAGLCLGGHSIYFVGRIAPMPHRLRGGACQ